MVRPRGNTTWFYQGNIMWYTMVQSYHGILHVFTITQKPVIRSVSNIAAVVGLCILQACFVHSNWYRTNSNRQKCLPSVDL